jgi:hypothetical protein
MINLRVLPLFLALFAPFISAAGPDVSSESCEQIRTRIGVAPLADPDLLRQLALRKDCGFTAAEVYRAVRGDKPPPQESDIRRHQHDDDD